MPVRYALLMSTLLILQLNAAGPFTSENSPAPAVSAETKTINRILHERGRELKLPVIQEASDAVFLRRAYLSAAGRIPTRAETLAFLNDPSPGKRLRLIDHLLDSEAHADLIAMRFADMLRIKSEFPVNLWPNAVQAFHQKLRTDILNNRPYSEMVFEMLTASGSNFRVPYANFFRGTGSRTPEGLAEITARTFMGLQFRKLPPDEQKKFAAFFSRIRFKSTFEWKEEIVYTDPEPVRLKTCLPGTGHFTVDAPETEPRLVLAKALTADDNPYFARAFVNRAWSWFFGKGLIDPADDITPEPGFWANAFRDLGLDTPDGREVQPELLQFLTDEFRKSNYNMRYLFRLIMTSDAFQAASTVPAEIRQVSEKYFLSYPVRRLEAELIADAFGDLSGQYPQYSSVIPEPFTFLPKGTRATQLADGSISSGTLEMFGRPARDSGAIAERNSRISDSQRLFLLNSNRIYRQLNSLGTKIARECKWDLRGKGVEYIYLTVLSRRPTPEEVHRIMEYYNALPKKQRGRVWSDLVWVLANSKEFLYHH